MLFGHLAAVEQAIYVIRVPTPESGLVSKEGNFRSMVEARFSWKAPAANQRKTQF